MRLTPAPVYDANAAGGEFVDDQSFDTLGLQQVAQVEQDHAVFVSENFFHAPRFFRINS